MEEQLQACNMQFLSISGILVFSILGIFLGRKIIMKTPGFSKVLRMLTLDQQPVTVNLHREVTELRKATLQIAQDWVAMTSILTTMKDQQNNFILHLDSDFEAMSNSLQSRVKVSLEEESNRNDQRFSQILAMIEGFRNEFLGVKEIIQGHEELIEKVKEPPPPLVDGWSQTEKDMVFKKRPRETLVKAPDEAGSDNETARSLITAIKKALAEFLKEVKKHLLFQREEGMSDMKVIFSQLSEDKEEIKCTIESAFSTAMYQTQKSFEQFGLVGHEAMKCIQALNEKSDNCLAARFREFGDRMMGVFDLLKGLNFDVSSIKQVLDNIDGQFDEIYQKLELSCQKNTDHREEVTNRLQQTAEEWNDKSSNLDQLSKQLGSGIEGIKETLSNLNNLIYCKTVDAMAMYAQQYHPPDNVKVASNLSLFEEAILVNKNFSSLEQFSGPEGLGAVFGMIHVCFGKLNSLNDQIEHGTVGIRESADILVEKLNFLTKLVEDNVGSLKNLNIQEAHGVPEMQQKSLNRELNEFIGNIINLDSNVKVDEVLTVEDSQYTNDISKSSGFYFKGMDSDKTSIVTVFGKDAQDGLSQTKN